MSEKVLNQNADQAALIANNVAEFIQHELGYEDGADIIPGLLMTVGLFAVSMADPQRALDEASDLLQSMDEEEFTVVQGEEDGEGGVSAN